MLRRNFISNLGSAILGCYLAVGVELKSVIEPELVINPAWVDAEYDIEFYNFEAFNLGPPPDYKN